MIWQYAKHINLDESPVKKGNWLTAIWIRGIFEIGWCLVATARLCLLTYHNPPFSPPPPTLRVSSSFSYLVPYHLSVCCFAHGHTEVFHNTSFDINYWHNLLLKVLSHLYSFLAWLFAHLRNTSLPDQIGSQCKSFQIFFASCHITHEEGIGKFAGRELMGRDGNIK